MTFGNIIHKAKFILNSHKYQIIKDYQKDISILKNGISIWPRNSQLYGLLGAAYYYHGNRLKAEATLKKALELNPKNEMAVHYMKEIDGKR